jgi:Ca-activated chloride channel homolog
MNIASPALLVLGLLTAAVLAWATVTVARRRTAAFAAAGVAARSGPGRLAGAWLTIAGIAVLALAAAGPTVSIPVSHAKGTVVLAVDVSGSMAATDVAPSRLSAAKQAAEAFIEAQPGSVDVGVVAFEQGGIETAIPSGDHATAVAAVRRLGTGGGTSLGSAIVAALSSIIRKTVTITPQGNAPGVGYWPSATIVLFSDGQDGGGVTASAGGAGRASGGGGFGSGANVDTATAAAVAGRAGVHIDTVGVGTAAGTTVVAGGYRLFTALDAATLKSIAQATGGSYHPASNASELNGIASSIDLRLTVSNEPLPLAGALIALALALLAAGAVLTVIRTGRVI